MDPKKNDRQVVEELVIKAQEGDTDAFGQLYDIFIDQIYRYVFYKVGQEEVLDLTENIFLKAWEHLKTYKSIKGNFSSWLFRIAHNVVVDHYRLRKEFLELSADLVDDRQHNNPVFSAQQQLDQELLRKALLKLRKKYQQVILLKYINDLSNEEISKILGCSEGSLRILKFRALKALRKVLEEMGIQY